MDKMNDNFKCIYRILKSLEEELDSLTFDINKISPNELGISEARWAKYIEMMLDVGYIKGIRVYYDVNEELEVDNQGIKITLKGLEYLSENTIMQRMYKTFMNFKDAVK